VTPDDNPSPYAWSKIWDEMVGEWLARGDSGASVVVGRFGNVYGPGGPSTDATGTVVHTLVRRAMTAAAAGMGTFEAHGDPATVRSFIFVDDVARAVALLLTDERATGPFNVDTGIGLTIGEVADVVGRAVAAGMRAVFTGEATDVPYRVTDPSRLGALGFAAQVEFSDGIARCVAAERLTWGPKRSARRGW
jgi:nucleoside-diphosphate-sugar epimerase